METQTILALQRILDNLELQSFLIAQIRPEPNINEADLIRGIIFEAIEQIKNLHYGKAD